MRSDTYHLYGAHLDNAIGLDHRPEGWVVFFSERGGEWSTSTFESEDQACAEVLKLVTAEEHNFFQLVVGPAPAEAADAEWAAWLGTHRIRANELLEGDWKVDDVPWVAGPYWRRYFVRITTVRLLEARMLD